MKKTTYTKPAIQVVRIQVANHLLGLSQGGPVQNISNDEGFSFESNGLNSEDDLR
jgi:hypothetical protein